MKIIMVMADMGFFHWAIILWIPIMLIYLPKITMDKKKWTKKLISVYCAMKHIFQVKALYDLPWILDNNSKYPL